MELTIIGCAGSYPTPASPTSCYLVQHDGVGIVLDLGNGALGPLQEHIDPVLGDGLAGVVLSHCHIDHCADIGSLFVMRNYGPEPPSSRLRVLGPSTAAARAAGIYGMPEAADLDSVFAFESIADATSIGPFDLEVITALHPVEAYSVRVTAGGRSLTYSGDTGPNRELVRLATGTDLALFEASFVGTGNPVDLHMSGAEAARAAAQAGAGRLVLTHLVTWNDSDEVLREAAEHFSGPIDRAAPGQTFTI
jgi:ribonuclease BN (tRNA processing enzyme)